MEQGLGIHPHQDPWGQPFSEAHHPKRFAVAGSRLSGEFTYALDGVQGDADFVAALFNLNRISKHIGSFCVSLDYPNETIANNNNLFFWGYHFSVLFPKVYKV